MNARNVPITVGERSVRTSDGIALRVDEDGPVDGPALLLLNSLGTDASVWDHQIAPWSADRRVIRFDQRGHGGSQAPSPPYTIERLGQDAIDVLDARDIDRADVCGLSLGGLVALWLTAHHPDRCRRAVLADTAPRVGTADAWRQRIDAVRAGGMSAIADQVLERFFTARFRAEHPEIVGRIRRTLLAVPTDGYIGSCEALATADLRAQLPGISVPCLVVVGSADAATPPSAAQQLHARLPTSRLAELPGAGHLSNLESPVAFERLVAGFLAGDEAGLG